MTDRNKCYSCVYRGNVPGSAHSSCNHPAFNKVKTDPLLNILQLMGANIQVSVEGVTVVGNEYGRKKGWFSHPHNFDPAWLEKCTGYKAEGESNDVQQHTVSG